MPPSGSPSADQYPAGAHEYQGPAVRESAPSGGGGYSVGPMVDAHGTVRIARIYDEPSADDGRRILVDRLWPRGVSKERAHLDDWCKEIAPSTELRRWYGHDPDLFEEFSARYRAELSDGEQAEALSRIAA